MPGKKGYLDASMDVSMTFHAAELTSAEHLAAALANFSTGLVLVGILRRYRYSNCHSALTRIS